MNGIAFLVVDSDCDGIVTMSKLDVGLLTCIDDEREYWCLTSCTPDNNSSVASIVINLEADFCLPY